MGFAHYRRRFDRIIGVLSMAISVASLSRSGLRDWLLQRLSAYYMLFYLIGMAIAMLRMPAIHYLALSDLFSCPWMPVLSFIFVLCVATHAWIGLWTVLTDYVNCKYARLSLYVLLIFSLLCLVIWSATIFWSV